jgi:tRNA threonylcarbamoyl adenosine modification protein YeaZ
MILAIDTSAGQCAVALVGSGDPVVERQAMDRGHAEHLFPMIESVLARAGIGYDRLGRIAVCTGPGSFTGVRVGVAAARGIALGRAIPVIGISRFEALAAEAGGPVTICLSGRGGTTCLQSFDPGGVALAEPEITTQDRSGAALAPGAIRFAGDAAPRAAGQPALLPDGLPDPAIIARLAIGRDAAAPPAPIYLRGADAALPREGPPALLD